MIAFSFIILLVMISSVYNFPQAILGRHDSAEVGIPGIIQVTGTSDRLSSQESVKKVAINTPLLGIGAASRSKRGVDGRGVPVDLTHPAVILVPSPTDKLSKEESTKKVVSGAETSRPKRASVPDTDIFGNPVRPLIQVTGTADNLSSRESTRQVSLNTPLLGIGVAGRYNDGRDLGTGVLGTGGLGTGVLGTGVAGTGVVGAGVHDTGVLGTGVHDTGVLGTGVHDTGVLGAAGHGAGVLGAGVGTSSDETVRRASINTPLLGIGLTSISKRASGLEPDVSADPTRPGKTQVTETTDQHSSEESTKKAAVNIPLLATGLSNRSKRASQRIFGQGFINSAPSLVGYQSNYDRFPTVA